MRRYATALPFALLVSPVALVGLVALGSLVALASVGAPTSARAQEGAFTLEAFLEVPFISSPEVSPDGKQVAYLWNRRDLAEDEYIRQVWLADAKSGDTRRLTFGDDRPRGVAWRPGGGISYLRAVDGAAQVWWNPLDGSEPRALTDLEGGVGAYWWAPDGDRLAVLAAPDAAEVQDGDDEGGDDEDGDDEDGDDDAATEDDAAATDAQDADDEIERADWTVWDRLEQPDEYAQVWLVAVTDTGPAQDVAPRRLTDPPLYPHHAAWSPDGGTLALTYNPRFSSLVDEDQLIALVDVGSGSFTPITPTDRHSSLAAFSPDGERLAYFTDRGADLRAYLNLKDVVVRDLDSGQSRVVTVGTTIALGGSGALPAHAPVWSENGRHLYLQGVERTTQNIYRIDVRRAQLERMTELAGNVVAWNLAGGTLAYIESELHRPGTLWARPAAKDRTRALATTDDAVAAYDLRPPARLELPGHDGGLVEGFLFLPPGASESERLPGIVEMHGGPFSRYGNTWTTRYPWQVLSQDGFAVFIANPRGGTGYGEEFLRGVYRNFGTDDYADLMAAVDALVERGTLDPQRLGFTGYSYGGLMTNVVISRTDRFAAAVSIAGIYNYVSAMGQNNPQLFIDSYQRAWDDDLQRLWEHSPASRADRISTPTLVMHGEEDEPVDPRQSIELFSYLQLNGVPSRLVLYPGEGHGINRPSHMIDYQTRELEWFRHYLLGDAEAAGAETPVPVEPAR